LKLALRRQAKKSDKTGHEKFGGTVSQGGGLLGNALNKPVESGIQGSDRSAAGAGVVFLILVGVAASLD